MKLKDACAVIRSKNAGPYALTFDLIFKEEELFQKARQKGFFTKELIAELYHLPLSGVEKVVAFEPAKAFKITIARPRTAGALGETDVYGAQQHVPLLELELDL